MRPAIVLVVLAIIATHVSARTVTLTATAQSGQTVTNSIDIQEYETVELVGIFGTMNAIDIQKDGPPVNFTSQVSGSRGRNIVAGPAKVLLVISAESGPPRYGAVTLVIEPEAFPPDRTIIVAPGLGGAAITLECSTDLVNWTSATNGVYTNLPSAKFFRIKAERIP